MRRLTLLFTLLLTATAGAHPGAPAQDAIASALDQPCAGAPLQPTRVITGHFDAALQGSYVMVPFEVPAGTTQVRVKYCFDQPESRQAQLGSHTLDLGLWDPDGFRGWGGSSHPDVAITPQGFSSEAQYKAAPKAYVPGRTTRGYVPGPIPAGTWEVELGVASVAARQQGDGDGGVAWRVEIELSDDAAYAAEPYVPAPVDTSQVRGGPGWYAGDLHVHAEHSALGDATMREVFDYAFGAAQLDFVTLSDYVTSSAWGELGRYETAGLVVPSAEVITYRGHANNHGSQRYVDHRTGPVLVRADDGTLTERRGARPARELLEAIRAAGGVTQVNHPTIFPSEVPGFAGLCRGCPWDYSDAETDWSLVDAYEVHTGPAGLKQQPQPGPNPFTPLALAEYDRLTAAGHHIAAVAVSDSHHAGRTPNALTQAPIGEGTTVVYAEELSQAGILDAVRAGHTYVKLRGSRSPDLRLEATAGGRRGIMGDVLAHAADAALTARVLGADPAAGYELAVLRDGVPVATVPVTAAEVTIPLPAPVPGAYRLQLQRAGTTIEAATTPVWLR